MVSPSRTETTGPEKSPTAREGMSRNRKRQIARGLISHTHRTGGAMRKNLNTVREIDRASMSF